MCAREQSCSTQTSILLPSLYEHNLVLFWLLFSPSPIYHRPSKRKLETMNETPPHSLRPTREACVMLVLLVAFAFWLLVLVTRFLGGWCLEYVGQTERITRRAQETGDFDGDNENDVVFLGTRKARTIPKAVEWTRPWYSPQQPQKSDYTIHIYNRDRNQRSLRNAAQLRTNRDLSHQEGKQKVREWDIRQIPFTSG